MRGASVHVLRHITRKEEVFDHSGVSFALPTVVAMDTVKPSHLGEILRHFDDLSFPASIENANPSFPNGVITLNGTDQIAAIST
jgi:hypothetical protein